MKSYKFVFPRYFPVKINSFTGNLRKKRFGLLKRALRGYVTSDKSFNLLDQVLSISLLLKVWSTISRTDITWELVRHAEYYAYYNSV